MLRVGAGLFFVFHITHCIHVRPLLTSLHMCVFASAFPSHACDAVEIISSWCCQPETGHLSETDVRASITGATRPADSHRLDPERPASGPVPPSIWSRSTFTVVSRTEQFLKVPLPLGERKIIKVIFVFQVCSYEVISGPEINCSPASVSSERSYSSSSFHVVKMSLGPTSYLYSSVLQF